MSLALNSFYKLEFHIYDTSLKSFIFMGLGLTEKCIIKWAASFLIHLIQPMCWFWLG